MCVLYCEHITELADTTSPADCSVALISFLQNFAEMSKPIISLARFCAGAGGVVAIIVLTVIAAECATSFTDLR